MPADSNYSLAEVQAEFDDNASYLEERSPAKARKLLTAGTSLIRRMPSSTEHGLSNERLAFNLEMLKQSVDDARKWLASEGRYLESTVPAVRYADLSDFREWGHGSRRRDGQ